MVFVKFSSCVKFLKGGQKEKIEKFVGGVLREGSTTSGGNVKKIHF